MAPANTHTHTHMVTARLHESICHRIYSWARLALLPAAAETDVELGANTQIKAQTHTRTWSFSPSGLR